MNLCSPKQNSKSSGENVGRPDQFVEARGIGDGNGHSEDASGDRRGCRTMWDPGTWKEMEIGPCRDAPRHALARGVAV